jgi:hypothetical protein
VVIAVDELMILGLVFFMVMASMTKASDVGDTMARAAVSLEYQVGAELASGIFVHAPERSASPHLVRRTSENCQA